jgi:hypothetical protein
LPGIRNDQLTRSGSAGMQTVAELSYRPHTSCAAACAAVNTIANRPGRLLVGNALVIGLGTMTYLVLRNLAHWQPAAISAVCGSVISAALIVAVLFEGWPGAPVCATPVVITMLPARRGRPGSDLVRT